VRDSWRIVLDGLLKDIILYGIIPISIIPFGIKYTRLGTKKAAPCAETAFEKFEWRA
jgi:hypothetical protein